MRTTVNLKNGLLIFTILFFIFLFACISNIFFIIEGVDNTLTNSQTNNTSLIPHLATAFHDAKPYLKQAVAAALPSLQQALSVTKNQLDSIDSTATVPVNVSTSSEEKPPAKVAETALQTVGTLTFMPQQATTK